MDDENHVLKAKKEYLIYLNKLEKQFIDVMKDSDEIELAINISDRIVGAGKYIIKEPTHEQAKIMLAWAGWMGCQSLRSLSEKGDMWHSLMNFRSVLAMSYKIKDENKIEELRRDKSELLRLASLGGKTHHSIDRQAFKADYRAGRGDDSSSIKPRPAIVEELAQYYCGKVKRSTMDSWAAEADLEDGFTRKAGRPKKG